MAPSSPFLSGMIMFSGISPDFGQVLKEEIFGCFKYIGIPYSEIMAMPTKDRKTYVTMHNKETREQEALLNNKNG